MKDVKHVYVSISLAVNLISLSTNPKFDSWIFITTKSRILIILGSKMIIFYYITEWPNMNDISI